MTNRLRYWDPDQPQKRGKASDFIRPFEVRPGQKFILCIRVSSRSQHKKRNFRAPQAKLRAAVEAGGGVVVDIVRYVGSGWEPFHWLPEAAFLAEKHGAILLAATTDRFIRSRDFHPSKRPTAQAKQSDLERLLQWTYGVPLMTYLHPDASPGESRSLLIEWGQTTKGRKGGRDYASRHQRKDVLLPQVMELHQQGWSSREIARELGGKVSHMTVRRWIREAKEARLLA